MSYLMLALYIAVILSMVAAVCLRDHEACRPDEKGKSNEDHRRRPDKA